MAIALKRALRWLAIEDISPELAVAQLREVRRHFLVLPIFLAINVIAVSYSHHAVAPYWLVVLAPAALLGCKLLSLILWRTATRNVLTGANALSMLRKTAIIEVGFATAYMIWALALNSYGDSVAQTHIAVFAAITMIGFVFCMSHLPQAALGIAVFAIMPYLAYYFAQKDIILGAIALDVLLVTLVVFRVLLNSFRSFNNLVYAKEEAERLHGEVTLLAHTDMLTGLPNRRLFFSELDKKIAACRAGKQLALGIIDLDRFKTANDTFGHLLGDELLEMAGTRLRKVFGRDHLIARLGGDEFAFAVLMSGAEATRLGDEACQLLSMPYRLGETIVHIGASCGIATTADVTASSRALYDSADYALYQGKNHRLGAVTLYSSDHEKQVKSERAIEVALQAAHFDTELDLHLQPIVNTKSGGIVAVEALARWDSPVLGVVRPDIFIPIAERAGLTHRMTISLFQKALTYIAMLPRDIQLSFNLSAHDLTSEATVLAIVSMVRRSGIKPSRLLLELTETAAMRDFAAAERAIRTLHAMGIQIALDDFGTGQSSLSYLHRLPIDKVKLDRSFLMEAGGRSGRDLLGAVVALCHSLKMRCVAEGVEDGDQLKFLQEINCDLYQGYFFAKPMPIMDLVALFPRRQSTGGPRRLTG